MPTWSSPDGRARTKALDRRAGDIEAALQWRGGAASGREDLQAVHRRQVPAQRIGPLLPARTQGGRLVANVCRASRKDFRDAVVAARNAFATWAQASAYLRGQILYRDRRKCSRAVTSSSRPSSCCRE